MPEHAPSPSALPPVVDHDTWRAELDALRVREKAATRELDAIAAQRRRLPMVEMPDYVLIGPDGPIRLVDVFDGRSQLIVYNHMWAPGEEWQCGGCTSFTSVFTRLGFLEPYDARFVVVTNGPIDEALAYRRQGGEPDGLVLVVGELLRRRRGRAAGRRLRGQRVPARRRHRVPHLAHLGPRHRTAHPHLRPRRRAAVGASGGLAGLAAGLAELADLLRLARLTRHRPALRARRTRSASLADGAGECSGQRSARNASSAVIWTWRLSGSIEMWLTPGVST